MVAKISVKGQTVIPEAIREQARLQKGDELDFGYANGLIVRAEVNRNYDKSDLHRIAGVQLPSKRVPTISLVTRL